MKNPSKFETGSRIASGIRIMGSEGTLKKTTSLRLRDVTGDMSEAGILVSKTEDVPTLNTPQTR